MGFLGYQSIPLLFQPNNQTQPQPPSQQANQERKPPLEDMFMQFMSKMEARDAKVEQVIQNQQATIQNLERQMGQLAKAVLDRDKGKLPSTS